MNDLKKNCDSCEYGNDGCDRVCDGTYSGWTQKSEQTGDLISKEALIKRCMNGIDNEFIPMVQEAPAVPAIPISVIEQIKADIEKRQDLNTKAFKGDYNEFFDGGRIHEARKILEIIDRHIKEYTDDK